MVAGAARRFATSTSRTNQSAAFSEPEAQDLEFDSRGCSRRRSVAIVAASVPPLPDATRRIASTARHHGLRRLRLRRPRSRRLPRRRREPPRVPAPAGPRAPGRAGPVQTQAFFNFGGVKQPPGVAMVCRDCGYVYRGMDFNDLPKDYKCPPCGSGKNAFRPEKKADFVKDGFNAPGARSAKRANQQAFRAKRQAMRKKAEQDAKKR